MYDVRDTVIPGADPGGGEGLPPPPKREKINKIKRIIFHLFFILKS
jgi:hypothetical protein